MLTLSTAHSRSETRGKRTEQVPTYSQLEEDDQRDELLI